MNPETPTLRTPTAFDYGIRLAAYDQTAIVARTGTRRILLGSHIRAVGIITSPGDHAGIWGIAEAEYRPNVTANILATGDPTTYDGQHDLWDALGRKWGTWITSTLGEGALPQVAVANREAANRLIWSAKRVVGHPKTTATARSAARFVLTIAHGMKAPGQQGIIVLSEALREHYVTGADPLDETHLGHWIEYPHRTRRWDREQTGLDEDFEAESTKFGRAVDRMNGSEGHMRAARAARVIPLLKPTLTTRFTDVISGLKLLEEHPGNVAPVAETRYTHDQRTVARFWENETVPGFRSLGAKVRTLHDRENATEQWRKALWEQDCMERARGILTGDVLTGTSTGGPELTVCGPVRARAGDQYRLTSESGDEKTRTVTVRELSVTADGATVLGLEADLEPGACTLTPVVPARRPAPWVAPTWVHSDDAHGHYELAPPSPAGGYTAWAESMKTHANTQIGPH